MSRFAEALQRFASNHHKFPGVELVYTSHNRWPLPITAMNEEQRIAYPIRLSVLDASFNPPTMAHLALLRIQPPRGSSPQPPPDFGARLLLYSIKNADKSLKPGDATHLQRLEMMVLLARDLEQAYGVRNVAVALCQEPTFVGKSTALRQFLSDRLGSFSSSSNADRATQLFFLLGFDTLERLFVPRYYGSEDAMKAAIRSFLSPSGDDSRIICARRSAGASYSPTTDTDNSSVLKEAASDLIEPGAISIVNIGNSEQSLSSSEIRESVKSSNGDWAHKVPPSVAEYINDKILYK